MQGFGSQLLPGAALAADQLGSSPICYAYDRATDFLDGVARAEKTKIRAPRYGILDLMEAEDELTSDGQDDSAAQVFR